MSAPSGDAPLEASSQISPEQAIGHFLDRIAPASRLLVAFSGGGDSTGLLAALAAARDRRPGLVLHAATVDHGLRAGSAEEAAAAARASHGFGVPHSVLRWVGDKPASGIQAAARLARYHLLAEKAARLDADMIVTGHTRDDQAETIAMRQARNPASGTGMDEAVLVERKAWVVRPFLDVSRQAIRDYLGRNRLAWIDDPSNDNPAFERVRVRRSAPLHTEDERPDTVTPYIVSAEFIRAHLNVRPGPVAVVDLRDFDAQCKPHRIALSYLAAIIGGREYGLGGEALALLEDRLAASANFRMTTGRVLFDRRGQTLCLVREARGLPRLTVGPGQAAVWDGRFEIENRGASPAVIAAGASLVEAPPLVPPVTIEETPKGIVRAAAASIPRLLEGDPGTIGVRQMLAPFEKFVPARKLKLAESLAKALGLELFPQLPLGDDVF
jgi:tRNA(Ile)-lysidine synthase